VFQNTLKAELKFYLCVAEGGKGCNIGEPNDDLFSENDSEFVHIQKNYGHPWHSDIKQFDLMYIDARNKEHPQRERIYPLWVKTNSAHRYHFLA
jgi:hypothetical protein